MSMTDRERFIRTMRYEPVDRRPLHLVGAWSDTMARWRCEGLPQEVKDVNAHLGVQSLQVINLSGTTGFYPPVEGRLVSEDATTVIRIDSYGRTIRDFKDHTSMPEWLDFPVKTPEDLRRYLDEHMDVSRLDERFGDDWKKKMARARATPDALTLLDGGCYYWSLRSIAGVEVASYLLYDAPELVDELFERYLIVTLESMKRVMAVQRVDLVGFGEDLAYKTGPLLSPGMFRSMIAPRYRKAMELARSNGTDLTWYDSDGDLRMLIPDYLELGIDCLAPCEVAAGMDPVGLRAEYGRRIKMIGGFDKRIVASGKAAIDAEFKRLQPVIREGGYLSAIDHSVSADISWDAYRYFVEACVAASGG
jgi:uroporphyrinogen decarboxylase